MHPYLGAIIFSSRLKEPEKAILEKPGIKNYQSKLKHKQTYLYLSVDPNIKATMSRKV